MRDFQASDRDAVRSMWNAQRERSDSCWSVAQPLGAELARQITDQHQLRVLERSGTIVGVLILWERIENPRISILADDDFSFAALLGEALEIAQRRGGDHVYGLVPLEATNTRRQLAAIPGITWDHRGGYTPVAIDQDPTERQPVRVWAVATVNDTLPALTREER